MLTLCYWRQGPYVETRRTHLAKVIGDDNVFVVKIIGESSKDKTDFAPYHKVAEDGIFLGLRRYQFFRKFSLSYSTQQISAYLVSYCGDDFYISWQDLISVLVHSTFLHFMVRYL
jgi:hypothetical protein